MSPLERWSLHLSALFTVASGLLYGWLRYYGQRLGEFGPEPHPLQGLLQHLHVLGAPLLVFTLGMVVRAHVLPRIRSRASSGRATGLLIALGLAPMILSGYGIQIVTEPATRVLLAWVHGISSLLFLAAYGAHVARTWAVSRAPWVEVVEA
jgi:hypothetical protein